MRFMKLTPVQVLLKSFVSAILFFIVITSTGQPVINSFSPQTGSRNTFVAIQGSNFTNVTAVKFGDVNASSFFVVSSMLIQAIVDTGASGAVTVETSFGISSLSGFTFIPAPVVSSFTPTTGSSGTTVVILGRNFSGASEVRFGNVPASSFTVLADTQITAIVGTGRSGNVNVKGPGGQGSLNGFTHQGPALFSYTPIGGPAGTTVFLKGANFSTVTGVSFQDIPAASFSILSDSTISAVTAPGSYGQIEVISSSGSGSLPGFNLPAVYSFSPLSGPYNTIDTIRGRNFTGATSVLFGNKPATSLTVVSDSVIIATVGTGESGKVSVYNIYGTGASVFSFNFIQRVPQITSFTPSSGNAGTVVTIRGNYLSGCLVTFGNTISPFVNTLSDTLLTATVGTGASGKVGLSNTAGQVLSIDSFIFTGPTILSFNPVTASPGDEITITGTRLNNVTGVSFGGTPAASFTAVSATQVKAVVGNGSSNSISVNTALGTATIAGFYMKPQISSFSPANAGAFAVITIRGKFLNSISSVRFGPHEAQSFTYVSDTVITAVVGETGGNNISVTTLGGTVTAAGFTFIPGPIYFSLAPVSGSRGTEITITGDNLQWTTGLSVGGVPVDSFVIVDRNLLKAYVGNGASGQVRLETLGGIIVFGWFFYFDKPQITSFTPVSGGPMDLVSIKGTNLQGIQRDTLMGFGEAGYLKVRFGGIECRQFGETSDTLLNVYLTESASGYVYVETPGGKDSLPGFIYKPVPVVTDFNPVTAPTGDTITINGRNFSSTPANNVVYFGGTAAKVVTATNVSLQVIVPAGATFEPISVTVNTKTGSSKKPFVVSYPGSDNFSRLSYSTKLDLRLPYQPVLLTGDINGDGKLDLVVSDRTNGNINILVNSGTPGVISFEPAVTIYSAGMDPKLQLVKDVDGDGLLDILFTGSTFPYFSGKLKILKNSSTVSSLAFSLIPEPGIANNLDRFILGDLNADGRPDLLGAPDFSTTAGFQWIYASLNQTGSAAGPMNFMNVNEVVVGNRTGSGGGGRGYAKAVSDFNNDGRADVLVGISPLASNNYFTILQNNGPYNGYRYVFFTQRSISYSNANTDNPKKGDLNTDALPDIICNNQAFINTGNFNFTRKTIACADCDFIDDMDGDGKADLGKLGSDSFDIVRNKTVDTILLTAKTSFYTGANASRYQIGDLDGDGKPEIIVERSADSIISILRNKAGENIVLCPGGSTSLTSNVAGATYQWQVNKGSGFVNVNNNVTYSGANASVLQLNNMADSAYGYQYRCLAGNKYSYVFSLKFENTWTGGVNNAWENTANWSCGQLPSLNTDVIINSGSPVVSSNVTVRSLVLRPGASVTVNTGFNFIIRM